jgi:uncharacterized repeat protein (TIGR01451 family)
MVMPKMDVDLGEVVTYTLTLTNTSAAMAYDVALTDTLPSDLVGDDFTWMGDIPANDSMDFVYTATVATDTSLYGETITNTATYDSDNAGSGQAQAAFSIIGPPMLELTKAVMPEMDVDPGDVVTYTLSLANNGDAEAMNILLTDTLPSEVTFGDFAMGTNVAANYANGTVTWNGDLPAGVQPIAIVYTATVNTDTALYGQTITNTATYDSANAGSGQAQAAFTVVNPPNLNTSAKVSSSAGQQVMPGDLVTYTITLSNTGDVDTTVMLTDTLGSYYTVEDAWDFTETMTGTLTWTGPITAGSQVTLHFVAQVVDMADLDIGMTTLSNNLTIDDNINLPFTLSDQDPPYVEISGIYLPLISRD